MITIPIPYNTQTIPLQIPDNNFKSLIVPKHTSLGLNNVQITEECIVQKALDNPIGTKSLSELAKGKKNIVIVTSDHTRNVPSKITLPLLLEQIRIGNPLSEITILIGTGLHRQTTKEEQRLMFGDSIVDNEHIEVNDAFCKNSFIDICKLPSGASFQVNKIVANGDLVVTEGFIEPHFFAGFSGGRKSILPGVCSAVTVNENHCFNAIANPNAKAGMLEGNPIHEDMVAAARAVNVAFILNVTLDHNKKISGAFAGDLETAHIAGVEFLNGIIKCDKVIGDIVVTSNGGYPLDQNLYQSPKALATAEQCAGEDGVIIMVAACVDGIGGEHFQEVMKWGSPTEIEERLSLIPAQETIPEMWSAQVYAKILKKHKVILVSDFIDKETVESVNLIYAKTINEALKKAFEIKGPDAEVVVIPDGVCTLIAN